MAWVTVPACTSESRTRPARIDKPAASPDVHPAGRTALDVRSKTAPFAHSKGGLDTTTQFQASYEVQPLEPDWSTMPCWSPGRLPAVPPGAGLPSIIMPTKKG